jgi:hypothetical protein
MYGFLFKKNFCDGWDNLFTVVVINVLFLISMVGVILLSSFVTQHLNENTTDMAFYLIQTGILFIGIFIFNIIDFAFGELSQKIANFEGIHLLDFFKRIPGVLLDAFLFSLLIIAIVFISVYSLTFYILQQQTIIGLFVGALLFWIDIIIALSLQWFVPIRSTFHNKFGKCLKKCFIIFMDNTGFSIIMGLYHLLLTALSILPIGFFPSITGLSISKHNAFRLRMYKYDYLEEHPELTTAKDRKKIPWEELIYDDRETLGPRKLRSFLFPWKEEK